MLKKGLSFESQEHVSCFGSRHKSFPLRALETAPRLSVRRKSVQNYCADDTVEWYDGNAYQKYAFEYIPGTSTGKIAWFVGEDQTFMMDGRAIGPNGNVAARQVSQEPMSMVLNLGMSGSWSEILLGDLKFPTIMHIDYVRLYQEPGQTITTCDPPGYPTTEYIANHADAYNNPNLTVSLLPICGNCV
jgi:hypothetical protein